MASLSVFSLKPLLLLLTLSFLEGCVEREKVALLDFKTSFASFPPNDAKLSSWNSTKESENCCTWEGVSCDNLGGVVSLDLSFQELESHQLRPSLLQLHNLKRLDFSWNNLAMKIPEFIGSFSKLIYLDLTNAGFFGMIPPQLGNLSNIQTLNLGSSNLHTSSCRWLSHLSSLETLEMANMSFSEARDWLLVIKKLPSLSHFGCYSCHFPTSDLSSTLTHHVNSSSSLQTLDLSNSYLSSSNLLLLTNSTSNLFELDLSDLNLDAPFPHIFRDVVSLENLDLSGNDLEVGIFNSIGNLCKLKRLDAFRCNIKESLVDVVQALSGCSSSSLQEIDLTSSNLTGTIPTMLKFQSLTTLILSDNSLDNIPPLLNTLPLFPASLINLNLNNNNLSGVLSDVHFSNLSNLQDVYLSNNSNLMIRFNKPLSGASYVDLSSTNLGPDFPSWLLSQNSFVYLDISHCNISGTIPIMFWRNLSPFMLYLVLSSNSLHGIVPNLPIHFYHNSDLIIDLSSNAFCGPIPFFFFMAHVLVLSKNNFSGFAPAPHPFNFSTSLPVLNFREYPNVSPNVVDISNNMLSGKIPHWLGLHTPKLGALILANNNLSGTIPNSIGHTVQFYVLSLRNNSFQGPLPSLLKNCSQLRILDLGVNSFSGFIPSWMGEDLKNLVVLSLASNSFTRTLPTSLCHLSSLQILDLSHNMLSRDIPSCIHDLTAMTRDVNSSLNVVYQEEGIFAFDQLREVFHAYIKWKSRVWRFQTTLWMVKLIDLSSNNLSGQIPTGLTSLVDLDSIDLSCNDLQGSIPEQIGQLNSLQVLNLSYNRLCGPIPPSLSEISSLEMLDFAHNNLSGRIPTGTQLQSFDPSAFDGNPELCGLPLRKCGGDDPVQQPPINGSGVDDKWSDMECFYGGMGTGFAFGFLGILGSLSCIRKWRYAFFRFAAKAWILLAVAVRRFS